MNRRKILRALPALALCLALGACGDDKSSQPPTGIMPDFSLTDVNPNSATYQQQVSPRDYLQKVSAWYFGHST